MRFTTSSLSHVVLFSGFGSRVVFGDKDHKDDDEDCQIYTDARSPTASKTNVHFCFHFAAIPSWLWLCDKRSPASSLPSACNGIYKCAGGCTGFVSESPLFVRFIFLSPFVSLGFPS